MPYLTEKQIEHLGLKAVGNNVLISDKCSIYGASNIELHNNIRIDDFCILSAGEDGIVIKSHVHIACFCSLIGKARITMEEFSGISSRVSIYSSSDDYSGKYLTNPTVPEEFKNVIHGEVYIGKHVIVGVGSTILPNVRIGEGSAIGAYSLVTKNIDQNVIAIGVPAKRIKSRSKDIFDLERTFLNEAFKGKDV